MNAQDARIVNRWIHAADGRTLSWDATEMWGRLLDDIELEDALDVIVQHYRASDELLWPATLIHRAKARQERRHQLAANHGGMPR